MDWISVKDKLPEQIPGQYRSTLLLVCCKEFGHMPCLAVARCGISSLQPHTPIWYLDTEFYRLERPYYIAEQVTHWIAIPEPPEEVRQLYYELH